MIWTVELAPEAARELRKLDSVNARRLLRFLNDRVTGAEDPRRMGEALRGAKLSGFWKYRVGDYRLICHIEDAAVRVLVLRVGHRREVYR